MNEQQFNKKGKLYHSARPAYPEALFQTLREQIPPQSVVADVGSGTGIFSARLLTIAQRVFAVEPNESMRAAAEEAQDSPRFFSVAGSAEATSLPCACVDCVTAAQAFHWFDQKQFRAECLRILKPGGLVFLVWNDRELTDPVILQNAEINARFCPRFRGFSNGDCGEQRPFLSSFFGGEYQTLSFPNPSFYSLKQFIARNLSSSFAPFPEDTGFSAYVAALTALFEQHCQDGILRYPYTTHCYFGKLS